MWLPVRSGGAVARVEVSSRDALALRVGLRVEALDNRVELRFAGSDAPSHIVAVIRGDEAKQLRAADGLFWSPSTDGEAQLIEVFRPAGVPASAARLQAPSLSHLIANSRNDFKIIEKIGESGSCNVDTSCRVTELGPHFVDAKNAVAHMQFVQNGATYICTGTLLADTAGATQVPYFYSANHCFSASDGAPSPTLMQGVANTLNTFWSYEATACRSGVSTPRTQIAGGATYLYSDADTDAMLLRLNSPAPAGTFFAGWTAAPLAPSSPVTAIHHPRGDAKKVSTGQHVLTETHLHRVGWLSGTTEGGSSGSALFTAGRRGYELRGGLYGGSAACPNSGSLDNLANRDVYSRFDLVFPRIRDYLASEPVALNGSAPLMPPDNATSVASQGSSVSPATLPAGDRAVPPLDSPRPSRRTGSRFDGMRSPTP
ncbi:trypsin-like serine peptidase [Cognatilysobacter bugurensis]|uniref:trypsin-like serine peptidase n=1 Tax=Cognatilysobacter bugurensis TaxID=543356 RepID=UPI001E3C1E8D|nr:serine protease [Lysobacter bugurensis]